MPTKSAKLALSTLLASSCWLLAPQADAAIIMLQNDGFIDGGQAAFQQGFVVGEMAGVTLGPVTESFTVRKIQFLFGPAQPTGNIQAVTVRIYDDAGTPPAPGAEIYSADFNMEGANDAMSEVDLTGQNVIMPSGGSIRVAFEFQHAGFPCIARDADGLTFGANWIHNGTWHNSEDFGVPGDWVIRAEIETAGGAGGGGPGGTGGTGGTGAGGTGGTAGTGGTGGSTMVCTPGQSVACVGPGGCQGGQTCLADGSGFDPCVCGGDDSEDDGGCSLGSNRSEDRAGWPLGLGALASLLGLGAVRRRRRR